MSNFDTVPVRFEASYPLAARYLRRLYRSGVGFERPILLPDNGASLDLTWAQWGSLCGKFESLNELAEFLC